MTRSFPKLLALGAGFAVFAGMLGGGLMLARADDTPTPPTAPAATTPAPTKPKVDPKAVSDDFLQKLADNLKIDVATLKDALKKTGEDELQKLVDDGVLTQDQADKLKGMFENADGTFGFNLPFKLPFFGMHPGDKAPSGGAAPNGGTPPNNGATPGGRGFRLPFLGMVANDAVAGFLGITPQAYQDELKSGKTPAEIAGEHGKTRDDLKTFLQQSLADRLAQAVKDNKLSQSQADDIKAKAGAAIDGYLDGTVHIGRVGPKNFSPNQPKTPPTAPQPSGGA